MIIRVRLAIKSNARRAREQKKKAEKKLTSKKEICGFRIVQSIPRFEIGPIRGNYAQEQALPVESEPQDLLVRLLRRAGGALLRLQERIHVALVDQGRTSIHK